MLNKILKILETQLKKYCLQLDWMGLVRKTEDLIDANDSKIYFFNKQEQEVAL